MGFRGAVRVGRAAGLLCLPRHLPSKHTKGGGLMLLSGGGNLTGWSDSGRVCVGGAAD